MQFFIMPTDFSLNAPSQASLDTFQKELDLANADYAKLLSKFKQQYKALSEVRATRNEVYLWMFGCFLCAVGMAGYAIYTNPDSKLWWGGMSILLGFGGRRFLSEYERSQSEQGLLRDLNNDFLRLQNVHQICNQRFFTQPLTPGSLLISPLSELPGSRLP